MTNTDNRLVSVKCAIYFWASLKIRNIVIADATGIKPLSEQDIDQFLRMGVNCEQISYLQDDQIVERKGKYVAEAMLIDFALKHSVILSSAQMFYKCTGKLFCRNFVEINNNLKRSDARSIFWLGAFDGRDLRYVDIRFYYTNKEFFHKYLYDGYMRSDARVGPWGFDTCTRAVAAGTVQATTQKPKISGFAGWTGEQTGEFNFGDLEKIFPCFAEMPTKPMPSV